MHNPDVMQQMYALYDGTQKSLDNTPDIRTFNNKVPGEVARDTQKHLKEGLSAAACDNGMTTVWSTAPELAFPI